MDNESLLKSLQENQLQLEQVTEALENADESCKSSLMQLQQDLIQLLELSLVQLETQSQATHTQDSQKETKQAKIVSKESESNKEFDAEYELFQREISGLCDNEEDVNTKDNDSLNELEGQEVRAPYYDILGRYSYYNAVALSCETDDYDEKMVRVLFSNPTCLAMLPCKFFLNGKCKFTEDNCKYSHGYVVPIKDLQHYKVPDYSKLSSGTQVLALHKGDLWHRGNIEDVLHSNLDSHSSDNSTLRFSFKCDKCNEVAEVQLRNVVPLYNVDEQVDPVPSKCTIECQEEDSEYIPRLMDESSSKFGEWERFTKGIGSKLMCAMGYVAGSGLGRNSEGRVEPVPTYVYPQGLSLDKCLQLRDGSKASLEGDEIKVVQKKPHGNVQSKSGGNRTNKQHTLFDVINDKLAGKSSDENCTLRKTNIAAGALKESSNTHLQKQDLQLHKQVKQLESSIVKLQQAKVRQAKDIVTVHSLDVRLKEKQRELQSLQQAQSVLHREQQIRKSKKEIATF